jgi:hypothetical protein
MRSNACATTGTGSASSPTAPRDRAPTWPRTYARSGSSSKTRSWRRRPARGAHAAGKRVLALTMAAIRTELEGVQLVGEEADAVLIGGADETDETNRVFSYMNSPARSPSSRRAPSSSACTRTRGGRRRAARCSTRAPSSQASSTRPGSRQRCSESRARPSSVRRSMRSTRIPSSRGWSATTSSGHRGREELRPEHDPRPHGQVPRRDPRRGAREARCGRRLDRRRARLSRRALDEGSAST